MKSALNLSLSLLTLLTFSDEVFSLTSYQIKQICKKEKRSSICIKNLKKKRKSLQEGFLIEIPVIPYKR